MNRAYNRDVNGEGEGEGDCSMSVETRQRSGRRFVSIRSSYFWGLVFVGSPSSILLTLWQDCTSFSGLLIGLYVGFVVVVVVVCSFLFWRPAFSLRLFFSQRAFFRLKGSSKVDMFSLAINLNKQRSLTSMKSSDKFYFCEWVFYMPFAWKSFYSLIPFNNLRCFQIRCTILSVWDT